jgi:hypothetical protein
MALKQTESSCISCFSIVLVIPVTPTAIIVFIVIDRNLRHDDCLVRTVDVIDLLIINIIYPDMSGSVMRLSSRENAESAACGKSSKDEHHRAQDKHFKIVFHFSSYVRLFDQVVRDRSRAYPNRHFQSLMSFDYVR